MQHFSDICMKNANKTMLPEYRQHFIAMLTRWLLTPAAQNYLALSNPYERDCLQRWRDGEPPMLLDLTTFFAKTGIDATAWCRRMTPTGRDYSAPKIQ